MRGSLNGSALARRVYRGVLRPLPLGTRRRIMYARAHHRPLSLRSPRRFTEKVNWRIVNDRRQLLAPTCDKLAMKEHAAAIGDPRLRIARTLWSGTDVRELAGIALPAQWVFKPNHESGYVYVGEGTPDVVEMAGMAEPWMTDIRERYWGEWAYGRARQCLLVEEHIGPPGVVPDDIKLFVFDGVPQLVQVDNDRSTAHVRRHYLPDWTPLGHRRAGTPLAPPRPAPARLQDLLDLGRALAEGFDFLRVDLYLLDEEIWFGEITPYPSGGLERYDPPDLDDRLGRLWQLPRL